MTSIIYNIYDYFANFFEPKIEISQNKIESYTNITIGNNYIPEIDNNVILCVLPIEFNTLKTQIYIERTNDTYYINGNHFSINATNGIKFSEDFYLFHDTSLIRDTNYFCKIINIQNYFKKSVDFEIDVKYYGHLQYGATNININIYDLTRPIGNRCVARWSFNMDKIVKKQIWISYDKDIMNTKSARKNLFYFDIYE